MIATLIRKEIAVARRDNVFLFLASVLALLLIAATLDGWNRLQADDAARAAAEETDRTVWVNQGANNPHGAAHFARYAFRSTPPLAAFDPGLYDYAGAAFWMEAHTQNPTTLRRAEDAAVQAPFPSLSSAWIIQVVGTLALAALLYSTIAGERERGTLKALLGAGVSTSELTVGKTLAVLLSVGLLSLALVLLPLAPVLLNNAVTAFLPNVLLLGLVYCMGLLAFAMLVLGISARAQRSVQAFSTAAILWLFMALLWPIVAGQLALSLYPDIDEQQLKDDIQTRAQTPFWEGDLQESAVASFEAQVIAEFSADSFGELGFDREALVLQAHEEFANQIYDELYGQLNGVHSAQDRVLRYASALSPILALQRVSSGLSGTDLLAQQTFAQQAELHRRKIIKMLNWDMMLNAGESGYSYTADRSLWESIPDFVGSKPTLSQILSYYAIELFLLLLWLVGASAFAIRSTRSAVTGGGK
ncbi:MAG: ABC transporter permease subunit [Pseudomonadota bacterium]